MNRLETSAVSENPTARTGVFFTAARIASISAALFGALHDTAQGEEVAVTPTKPHAIENHETLLQELAKQPTWKQRAQLALLAVKNDNVTGDSRSAVYASLFTGILNDEDPSEYIGALAVVDPEKAKPFLFTLVRDCDDPRDPTNKGWHAMIALFTIRSEFTPQESLMLFSTELNATTAPVRIRAACISAFRNQEHAATHLHSFTSVIGAKKACDDLTRNFAQAGIVMIGEESVRSLQECIAKGVGSKDKKFIAETLRKIADKMENPGKSDARDALLTLFSPDECLDVQMAIASEYLSMNTDLQCDEERNKIRLHFEKCKNEIHGLSEKEMQRMEAIIDRAKVPLAELGKSA